MPWRPILFGGVVGYFLAVSSLPRDVLSLVKQILHAENKTAMGIIAASIVAVYCALILAPLLFCASKEREGWKDIHPSVRTSAMANLKRRGSLGNLEFLQPALRTNLLANAMRGSGSARDSRESPPPSARSDDGDSLLGSRDSVVDSKGALTGIVQGSGDTTLLSDGPSEQQQQASRRPRRARLYSGDDPAAGGRE